MASFAAWMMCAGVSKSGSPRAQADDVASGGFQLARLGRNGDGGRGLHGAEALGEEGHGGTPGRAVAKGVPLF
jgi:hypothetical protein